MFGANENGVGLEMRVGCLEGINADWSDVHVKNNKKINIKMMSIEK